MNDKLKKYVRGFFLADKDRKVLWLTEDARVFKSERAAKSYANWSEGKQREKPLKYWLVKREDVLPDATHTSEADMQDNKTTETEPDASQTSETKADATKTKSTKTGKKK